MSCWSMTIYVIVWNLSLPDWWWLKQNLYYENDDFKGIHTMFKHTQLSYQVDNTSLSCSIFFTQYMPQKYITHIYNTYIYIHVDIITTSLGPHWNVEQWLVGVTIPKLPWYNLPIYLCIYIYSLKDDILVHNSKNYHS